MKYVPYALIVMLAILIFTAGVVDGSGRVEANQEALTIAQGAARSGTNAAGGTAIDGDAFDLSGDTAVQAAQNYIRSAGGDFTGTATIQGQEVVVTVNTEYQTRLSWIFGVTQIQASGTAAARLIDG
jgi:hypothetical protein